MAAKEKDIQVRALLVEDNDIIIESLTELMKSMGFIAVNSKTGSEAINLLNGGSVGIVIADDKCGDKEGLEVLEEAKRISPVPPVFYSPDVSTTMLFKPHCASDLSTAIYPNRG